MVRLVEDIIDVCITIPLTIPANYVARSDYKSSQALNRLLFIINKMHEELTAENKNKVAKKHLRMVIIVCLLFTLLWVLEVSKLPDGCRIIYRDGTHGTLVDDA
jgi:hypothetical protein